MNNMYIAFQLQLALKVVGFSIVFGALFSKTYRVHVIFSSKSAKRVVSTNHNHDHITNSEVNIYKMS